MDRGKPVGWLCPDCMAPEENAEAEINYSTMTYVEDEKGRVFGNPKLD